MNRTKIAAADKATTDIIDHWHRAAQILEGGVTYNGHGVIADPSLFHGRLSDAKKALEEAMKIYHATSWPTREEQEE